MKLKEPKVFTLEEARQTLPLVKKIVADIITNSQETIQTDEKIRREMDKKKCENLKMMKDRLLEEQNECIKELDLIGCHLKNPRLGIIAFYWDRGDGLIVELCWRYGDGDSFFWNEIGSDKPIPIDDTHKQRRTNGQSDRKNDIY